MIGENLFRFGLTSFSDLLTALWIYHATHWAFPVELFTRLAFVRHSVSVSARRRRWLPPIPVPFGPGGSPASDGTNEPDSGPDTP